MSRRFGRVDFGRRALAVCLALMVPATGGGLLVGVTAAGAASTQPTFARTDYPSLANSNVAVDLNGDGRLDLAGLGSGTAAVLLATGDGTFGPRAEYPIAGFAQDIAAADVNGDGRQDLLLTVNSATVSLSLLVGNGDGTFQAPVNFANTTNLDSPAVLATDLNHDSRVDVVIAHAFGCFTAPCVVGRSISVLLGNGNATFQPAREIDVGTGMAKMAVGDFNRDGHKDLAIGGDSSRLYLLHGAGDGTFVQQPTRVLTADTLGVDATDVDIADFNGDTIGDLVVAIALNGSRTAILLGNANGTFGQPLILTDPGLHVPQYIAVADYNLDGFADLALALANGNSGLIQIRNGNGNGTFQAPVNQQVPPPQSSIGGVAILSAMLNNDTKPDIVLAWGGASSGLAFLRNTTGSTPPPTPSAPSLLSPAQDASPAQPILFDWTDTSAATSYRIEIDTSSSFSTPLTVAATVTASQFTAPPLAAQRHWWRVRAINSAGVAGPWSAVRRFTPRAG